MIDFECERYGKPLFPVSLFMMACLLVVFTAIFPLNSTAEPGTYVDKLLDEARQQKLHEDPYWWILLHYKKTLTGVESVVDDPKFFLSEKGKTDPESELEALIRTFFDSEHDNEDASVCSFIARYTWVKEKLEPDPIKIPARSCPDVETIEPRSATLVFPTYYLNNPASMFGHTFMNIETVHSHILLTNAVNYAAYSGNANSLQYVVGGIFGGFQGYFSILPYYKKIQEYSDLDQRDIWEYSLNLTPAELKKMVLHIREMENIGTDYYFFDENCSYHLLFLLEAARPSLKLTDSFGVWVIPIDTVKKMNKQGLIEHARFRPSNGTKIRQKLSLLPSPLQDMAYDICHGDIDPVLINDLDTDHEQKILMSDLVGDYMKYRLVKREVSQTEYQAVVMPNLRMRSHMGVQAKIPEPFAAPPDPATGHDSSRVFVAAGRSHHQYFQEIGINPSFSDLLNTDYTSREGIQIQFLETRLRYFDSDQALKLERCDILDIVSLFPRNRFFKPLSWKMSTGFRRQALPDQSRAMMYRLNSGTGFSWEIPHAGLFFVMPEVEARASGDLEKNIAAGVGLYMGLMKEILPGWKMLASAEALHFEPDDDYEETRFSLEQNVKLDRNNRLSLTVLREESFYHALYEGSLAWQHYF